MPMPTETAATIEVPRFSLIPANPMTAKLISMEIDSGIIPIMPAIIDLFDNDTIIKTQIIENNIETTCVCTT